MINDLCTYIHIIAICVGSIVQGCDLYLVSNLELCSSLNNPTDFPDNMDGAMNKPAYLNEHIDNCKCLQLRTSLHVDIKPDDHIFHFSGTQLKRLESG